MKVIRKTVLSNKMTLYWWTHFFWVTAFSTHMVLSSPIPFSSLETISTSLKSALVQNDNSFQQTGDQQKITSGKSVVPLTFETSDTDDVFGVADQINAENIAKSSSDWLQTKPHKNLNESASSTETPKIVSVKSEQSQSPSVDVIASPVNETNNYKNYNVNSTNASQITTIATTMLTNIDETSSSFTKTSTTPTTKLVRIEDAFLDEHIEEKSFRNSSDVSDTNQNDMNDTMEIVMTDDVTELSERKSKGLSGFSEEAKILNNISSRSTLQISSQNGIDDDKLSSEALFDSDTDNGVNINIGIISVICLGIIGSLSAFSIMFVYVYRRRFLNKPQTLNEPDSSGYEESIRDNSDELYSLDNDSFLNSLEAMTIPNFWTESVKHTKL